MLEAIIQRMIFWLGDKRRATGVYKLVHEDCEPRSQQRQKFSCEDYLMLEADLF